MPQCLSAFYNNPALFTAVPDDAGCYGDDFFEIIALDVAGLKTFWTITGCQVISVDGQMAMSAPQPGVVLFRQEQELAMIAGGHIASPPQVSIQPLVVCSRLCSEHPQKRPGYSMRYGAALVCQHCQYNTIRQWRTAGGSLHRSRAYPKTVSSAWPDNWYNSLHEQTTGTTECALAHR
jgi:hypothetical protein